MATTLPAETPEWGSKLLEIIQAKLKSVELKLDKLDGTSKTNNNDIRQIECSWL